MNELNGTHVFDRFHNTSDCNGAPFREAVNPVDACAGQDSWSSKVVLQTLESYSFDTYGGDSAAGCPSSSRGCAEQALDLCLVTFEGISKHVRVDGDIVRRVYNTSDCSDTPTETTLTAGTCFHDYLYGNVSMSSSSTCNTTTPSATTISTTTSTTSTTPTTTTTTTTAITDSVLAQFAVWTY